MVLMDTRARHGLTNRRRLSETMREFLESLPKSPLSSGRNAFFSEEMKKMTDKPVTERITILAEKWKALPESQKQHFEELAHKEQQNYLAAMKKFLSH